VTDRRQRSADEREADRLERERKRTGLSGSGPASQPPVPPRPPAQPQPQLPLVEPPPGQPSVAVPAPRPLEPAPQDRQPEPATVSSQPPIKSFPSEPEPDQVDADQFEDDHARFEVPSGIRRVSHRDQLAGRKRKPGAVKRRRPPVARRSYSPWIGRVASLIALVLAGALIWFLFQLFEPFGTSPHGSVTVTIPPRSSSSEIGNLLARDGVIKSSFFFEARATLAGDRSSMRSGTYHFQLGMSYGSVLTALTKAPPTAPVTELTISEGHTRQYVSKLLHEQKIKGDYLTATRRSPLLDPRRYGARHQPASLEGFLFPDTFKLVKPIKVSALVADQLNDFKQRFATVNLGYARRKHLTPYDVLKIASLIEAEAASSRDRPLVASVIYNRLADGMMLQFDSTARYATGNFTRPLTVSQLHSSSPYNTHTHFGLPPTPIDSPGLASIEAAAHPAQTKYLYFFSKPCTTGSVFATSYAQFENLLQRDRRPHC
jgi:UPF0755 protein